MRQGANAPNSGDTIDILALVRRYRLLIFVNVFLGCSLFLGATFLMTQKFKSIATITIYSKYFQNPLVKDFLPELYDTGELRAQRENLIRQAFSDDFLKELGEKNGLFKFGPGTPERETETDDLRKRIEIASQQPTTFTISFIYSDKKKTYELEKRIVDRIVDTLAVDRRLTISTIRDSIQRRVEGISLGSDRGNPDPMASARPELLRKELQQLEAQVSALENQYTPQHPKVARLRERVALIRGWLKQSGELRTNSYDKPVLLDGQTKAVTKEVYEDLLKKLNYLNILLDMDRESANDNVVILSPASRPTSPVWPNKAIFLMWGLLMGLLVSGIIILATEYFERSAPSVRDFAREVDLPFIGSLPRIFWEENSGKAPRNKLGSMKKKLMRFEEWN